MTEPNLNLFIQKLLEEENLASLVIDVPGVEVSEDILDENNNVLFQAGSTIGAETVDTEEQIRRGAARSSKYSTVAVVTTSNPVYTISEPQNVIILTSGSTVILPDHAEGVLITIKSLNSGGPVTVSGNSIDGVASTVLAAQYDFVEVVSNGSQWFKVASS